MEVGVEVMVEVVLEGVELVWGVGDVRVKVGYLVESFEDVVSVGVVSKVR